MRESRIGGSPTGGHLPQAALENHHALYPRREGLAGGMPGIYLGKIVDRHEDGTVDVTLAEGGTYPRVPVASWSLGTAVGEVYLPTFDPANPLPSPDGAWDVPGPSGTADLYCVVASWQGNARSVCVLGFVQPPVASQMIFATLGLAVKRHESGVWSLITPDGSTETHWPDGSYWRVGASTALHDMASENPAWAPPASGTAEAMVLRHSSGATVEISAAGAVTVTAASGQPLVLGTAATAQPVARKGDAITVTTSSGTYTGTITGGSVEVSAS
jgi:hypothetical protein